MDDAVFSESRRSVSDSYFFALSLLVVVFLGGFVYSYFRKGVDDSIMVVLTIAVTVVLAALVYILRLTLTTQVFDDRVVVTARKEHVIMFSEIQSHCVKEYSTIKDYGPDELKNMAYVVTGTKRGVEIVRDDGTKVYIASDYADALDAAIKA